MCGTNKMHLCQFIAFWARVFTIPNNIRFNPLIFFEFFIGSFLKRVGNVLVYG